MIVLRRIYRYINYKIIININVLHLYARDTAFDVYLNVVFMFYDLFNLQYYNHNNVHSNIHLLRCRLGTV